MAASHWKLIASTLGGDANARLVIVEGKNWLNALRNARTALGEPGGVPTGASCVMNADGGVTILDAATRSRYELRPTDEPLSTPPEPSPSAETAVASATAAPPVAADAPAPHAVLPAPSAEASDGPDDVQQGSGVRPARATPPPDAPAPRAPAEITAAPSADETTAPAQIAPAQIAPAQIAPAEAAPPAPVPAPGAGAVTATPRRQPSRPPRPEPQRGLPLSPPPEALRPISQTPAPRAPVAASPGALPTAPNPAAAMQRLSLVAARDEDPRPQSPLTYRERSYVIAPGASDDDIELGLRLALARIQDELRGAPRGQLVNLAVFDHAFSSAPQRGPVATLQWKDWRGEPVFERQPSAAFGVGPDGQLRPSQYPPELAPSSSPPPAPAAAPAPRAFAPRPSQTGLAPARPQPGVGPGQSQTGLAPAPPGADFGPTQPGVRPAAFVPNRPPSQRALPPAAPLLPAAGTSSRPSVQPDPFAAFPFAVPVAAPAPGSTRPSAPEPPAPPFAMTHPAPPLAAPEQPPVAHAPVQAPAPAPRPMRATLDYTQIAAARESHGATPLPAPPQGADSTGEQDRRLAHAFEAVQDLYFLATPAAGLEFVVKLLGELVPSEAFAASLYDINTDQLRCVAAEGPGSDARRASAVASNSGLVSVAAKSRRDHLVVNTVADDTRFNAEVDGFGDVTVRELAYFPMNVGIQLVGMLQLVNRRGRPGFTDADVAVGAYVASQAAQFVLDQRSRQQR